MIFPPKKSKKIYYCEITAQGTSRHSLGSLCSLLLSLRNEIVSDHARNLNRLSGKQRRTEPCTACSSYRRSSQQRMAADGTSRDNAAVLVDQHLNADQHPTHEPHLLLPDKAAWAGSSPYRSEHRPRSVFGTTGFGAGGGGGGGVGSFSRCLRLRCFRCHYPDPLELTGPCVIRQRCICASEVNIAA